MYKAYLTDNDARSARPVLLKYRFPKKYRHPALSTQLTRTRITSEARSLARCARGGVRVPQVVLVEVDSGIIGIEWIDGKSVRSVLGTDEEMVDNGRAGGRDTGEVTKGQEVEAGGGGGERGESKSSCTAKSGIYGISQGGFIFVPSLASYHVITIFITIFITITIFHYHFHYHFQHHFHCHYHFHYHHHYHFHYHHITIFITITITIILSTIRLLTSAQPTDVLMQLIGRELGRMHRADIIHGDLTTSNMLVRRSTTSTTSTSDVGADAEIVSGRPRPSPRQASH